MEPTNTPPTETPNVPPMPPELPTLAPEAPAMVIDAPATEAPATEAPATEAPATEAPFTFDAPATEAPATEAPAESLDLPTLPPELLNMSEQALSEPMMSGATDAAPAEATAPASNVVDFSADNPIGAMDPITMPTPKKAPNPEEEELKAPLKAAEPVPGSIGSAISVPSATGVIGAAQGLQTPSIAFNDPATQQGKANKSAKKKMNKTTLILLAVLGVVIVIVLVIVLINLLGSGR